MYQNAGEKGIPHDDPEDPPRGGDEPIDEQPPPEPDGVPHFDWHTFERDFREYSSRTRHGAGSR